MSLWKMPPQAKVYEALSAVADERVTLVSPTQATVRSSSGDKAYTVEWSTDFTHISSNDNASYWQGYLGYPIVAVLLALDRLTYRKDLARHLSGVHWKKINDQFKRDYAKAVEEVLTKVAEQGVDPAPLVADVAAIYAQLPGLKLQRGGGRKAPPPQAPKNPPPPAGQLEFPS